MDKVELTLEQQLTLIGAGQMIVIAEECNAAATGENVIYKGIKAKRSKAALDVDTMSREVKLVQALCVPGKSEDAADRGYFKIWLY